MINLTVLAKQTHTHTQRESIRAKVISFQIWPSEPGHFRSGRPHQRSFASIEFALWRPANTIQVRRNKQWAARRAARDVGVLWAALCGPSRPPNANDRSQRASRGGRTRRVPLPARRVHFLGSLGAVFLLGEAQREPEGGRRAAESRQARYRRATNGNKCRPAQYEPTLLTPPGTVT